MTRLLLALRLFACQLQLLTRDRQLMFWNIGFFVILLVMFAGLLSGGDTAVQVTLAAGIVTTSVMANALFSVGVGLTAARERGLFRLYSVTPVPPALPLYGTLCARALVVFAAAALQILVAAAVFGVPWTGGVLSWIAVAALGTAAFTGIGFAIAASARAPQVANSIANLVFMPMLALGGAALPVSMMPDAWADVYWILPSAAIFDGLLGAFIRGESVMDNLARLGYLAAWTVFATGWATYRWMRRGA